MKSKRTGHGIVGRRVMIDGHAGRVSSLRPGSLLVIELADGSGCVAKHRDGVKFMRGNYIVPQGRSRVVRSSRGL